MNISIKNKKLLEKLEKGCEFCKSKQNLEIHHIDKNPKNNKISNLKVLCRACHRRIHHKDKKAKTTTIRIGKDVKKKLDEVRGEASCNKFIDYLIEYFLGNTY